MLVLQPCRLSQLFIRFQGFFGPFSKGTEIEETSCFLCGENWQANLKYISVCTDENAQLEGFSSVQMPGGNWTLDAFENPSNATVYF